MERKGSKSYIELGFKEKRKKDKKEVKRIFL